MHACRDVMDRFCWTTHLGKRVKKMQFAVKGQKDDNRNEF